MGFVLIILILATTGVLVSGIVLMGVGGKTNQRLGNKLMVARVWLQASVLVVIALMFALAKNGAA